MGSNIWTKPDCPPAATSAPSSRKEGEYATSEKLEIGEKGFGERFPDPEKRSRDVETVAARSFGETGENSREDTALKRLEDSCEFLKDRQYRDSRVAVERRDWGLGPWVKDTEKNFVV